MNDQFLKEQPTIPIAQREAASSHALAPATLIEQCLTGALKERPRKGQGRREARHGRRKKP